MQNNIATRCERRLALNWGLLVLGIGMAVVVILAFKNREMPYAETMLVAPDLRFGLPVVLPRLVDPFVAGLITGCIFRLWRMQDIIIQWRKGKMGYFALVLAVGAVVGLSVSVLGVVSAVLIPAFVGIALAVDEMNRGISDSRQADSAMAIAAVPMWLVATVLTGTIPGCAYAILAVAACFGTYHGTKGVKRFFTGPFTRAMLSCDSDIDNLEDNIELSYSQSDD